MEFTKQTTTTTALVKSSSEDIKLSKTMSYILRHGSKKVGLCMTADGFVYVDELLALPQLKHFLMADVQRVVEQNDKQRFLLQVETETNRFQIRANQGHTVQVEKLDLKPILNSFDVPVVVHGTYHKSWKLIQTQGLSKMKRNHIHFAKGLPGHGVISGMRGSCQVCIYVDIELALKDGLLFYLSANDVILSPGNEDGVILPKYFSSVIDRKTGEELLGVDT